MVITITIRHKAFYIRKFSENTYQSKNSEQISIKKTETTIDLSYIYAHVHRQFEHHYQFKPAKEQYPNY